MSFDDTEQAKALQAVVKENAILTKIKDNILLKIEELHKYNQNHSEVVPKIMESELRKIMSNNYIKPEVTPS